MGQREAGNAGEGEGSNDDGLQPTNQGAGRRNSSVPVLERTDEAQ
jgi:hypothetical protein